MGLTKQEVKYGFHQITGFYKSWVGYDLQTFILDLGITKEAWQQIKDCKDCDYHIIAKGFIKKINEILK